MSLWRPTFVGNRRRGSFRIIWTIAASALAALNSFLAEAVFEPFAAAGRLDYVLVSPPLSHLIVWFAVAALALLSIELLAVHIAKRHGDERVLPNWAHVSAWLALSLIPLSNLTGHLAGRLPALSYVLFDLRVYWWLALAVMLLLRTGARLNRWMWPIGRIESCRILALAVITVICATIFTPQLRFSGVLRGDEPKYLRYCENLYQGHGFDISRKQRISDLPPDEPSHVLANFSLLVFATREELNLLAQDVRRLLGADAREPMVSAGGGGGNFLPGKHPGMVYQLHNPGLSFLLLPGYYIDRRFTGTGVGYQGEFPDSMPAVHVTLLVLYALYGIALYRLLLAYSQKATLSWSVALVGTVGLPAGAFAFQIYPEIAAGTVVFVMTRVAIIGLPSRYAASLGYGLLCGFLPWLHVRFILVSALTGILAVVDRRPPARQRAVFAASAATVILALSFYTYRMTGSIVPISTYGSEAPLSLTRLLHGLPALAVDREWGLLPQALFYILCVPGVAVTARRHPRTAILVCLVFGSMVIPAAGHSFWAAYTTTGRYLVSAAPLLLVFALDVLEKCWRRPVFSGVVLALALVTLETAISYNLNHWKDMGPLVTAGFSGWRPNLLFPSLGTETWSVSGPDLLLLVGWAIVMLAALLTAFRSPQNNRNSTGPSGALALNPSSFMGVVLLLGVVGLAVGRATQMQLSSRYLRTPRESREMALTAFAGMRHCAICYFSALGEVEPTVALGNDIGFVDVRVRPESPRRGERVTILIRPRSTRGEYVVANVRADLGDGTQVLEKRHFGDIRIDHVYRATGEHSFRMSAEWAGSQAGANGRIRVVP